MTRIRMGLALRLLLGFGVASLGGAGGTSRAAGAGGGQASKPAAQDQQQALGWARCMREHGINLPDPQITAGGGGTRTRSSHPPSNAHNSC